MPQYEITVTVSAGSTAEALTRTFRAPLGTFTQSITVQKVAGTPADPQPAIAPIGDRLATPAPLADPGMDTIPVRTREHPTPYFVRGLDIRALIREEMDAMLAKED